MRQPVFYLQYPVRYGQYLQLLYSAHWAKPARRRRWLVFWVSVLAVVFGGLLYHLRDSAASGVVILSAVAVPGCVAVLVGVAVFAINWHLRLYRRYRTQNWAECETVLRLYDSFFTVHMPSFAFSGQYQELVRLRRTEKETALFFKSRQIVLIPNNAMSDEVVRFLSEKVGGAGAAPVKEEAL